MGFYKPGAFKNKDLVSDVAPVVEELLRTDDEIKVEKNEEFIQQEVEEINENIKDELLLVKPVDNVVINEKWKKFKIVEEDVKVEDNRNTDIKLVRYLKHDAYLRRKKYRVFLDNEWDNLLDLYDRMLNYDINFLDKIRNREDDKGFLDFTKLVFVSLKRY